MDSVLCLAKHAMHIIKKDKVDFKQQVSNDLILTIVRSIRVKQKRLGGRRLWLQKYPNLIKEIIPLRPNHIWVSDITYIKTEAGFMYLFLITNAYSHNCYFV